MLGGELFGMDAIREDPLHLACRGLASSAGSGPGQEVSDAGCQRSDAVSRCAGCGLAHRFRKLLGAEVQVIEQSGKNSHGTSTTHRVCICMHT